MLSEFDQLVLTWTVIQLSGLTRVGSTRGFGFSLSYCLGKCLVVSPFDQWK